MKEIKFKVDKITPTYKLSEETVTRYSMEHEINGGKIRIEFTFKDDIPSDWLKMLGDSPGNEIIVSLGLKSRQTKLE